MQEEPNSYPKDAMSKSVQIRTNYSKHCSSTNNSRTLEPSALLSYIINHTSTSTTSTARQEIHSYFNDHFDYDHSTSIGRGVTWCFWRYSSIGWTGMGLSRQKQRKGALHALVKVLDTIHVACVGIFYPSLDWIGWSFRSGCPEHLVFPVSKQATIRAAKTADDVLLSHNLWQSQVFISTSDKIKNYYCLLCYFLNPMLSAKVLKGLEEQLGSII
jgi:hypothetical protein